MMLVFFGTVGFASAKDHDDHDEHGGYGGGQDKMTVCKATGSRFHPWVQVTIPTFLAEQWLENPAQAVEPDEDGDCPAPEITVKEFVKQKKQEAQERVNQVLSRLFDRLSHIFG